MISPLVDGSTTLIPSNWVVVDQCMQPQLNAKLLGLVTPTRVRWSWFQSFSHCSSHSLFSRAHKIIE